MQTQRQYPRHQFTFVLKVFDHESGVELGLVGDASPEGVLLVGSSEIQEGTRKKLRIDVPHPDGDSDELIFDAESKWSRPVEGTEDWLTGFDIEGSPLSARMLWTYTINDDN